MKKIFTLLLSASVLVPSGVANAAIVTDTLEVNASNFFSFTSPDLIAPYDTVTFRFSITFDNSGDLEQTTDGLTVLSNTLPFGAAYAYSSDFDILSIGTNPGPSSCSATNVGGNFCFFLRGVSANNPSLDLFTYSDGFELFDSVTVSVTRLAAVPEPATWAFMIFGFGAIGGAMRRQRKANVKVSYS